MAPVPVGPGMLLTTQELNNDHATPRLHEVLCSLTPSSNFPRDRQAALIRINNSHLVELASAFEQGRLEHVDTDLMEKFLQDLNCVLFKNASTLPIHFFWGSDLQLDGQRLAGSTEFFDDGYQEVHVDPKPQSLLRLFSVFVHELCHALVDELDRYRFEYIDDESFAYGEALSNKLNGAGGHGYHWQRLTRAVEKESMRLFGIQLDLRRVISALWDVEENESRAPELAYTLQMFDDEQRAKLHAALGVVDHQVDNAMFNFTYELDFAPNVWNEQDWQAQRSIRNCHLPNLQKALHIRALAHVSQDTMSHLMHQLTMLACPSILDCNPIMFYWDAKMTGNAHTWKDHLGRRVYSINPNHVDILGLCTTLLFILCSSIYEVLSGPELDEQDWSEGLARVLKVHAAVERNSNRSVGMQVDLARVDYEVNVWGFQEKVWPPGQWFAGVFDDAEMWEFYDKMPALPAHKTRLPVSMRR